MFYQCEKCKKTWQYPLFKCPDCFVELKRKKREQAKVIGVSKVDISTLLHPKTPYFVLVLEDENGNRWTHKSVQEYKMGDSFSLPNSAAKESVSICRFNYDYQEAIDRAIGLIGDISIKPEDKILILPTLEKPSHPYFSENTSPDFLQAMIDCLSEKGTSPENIKVGAQSFADLPIEAAAKKSQLLDICLKNKVEPLDLSKKDFVEKEKEGMTFEVSKEIDNYKLIINLPILKLDPQWRVRGAVENVFKLFSKKSYLGLKYLYEYPVLLTATQKILPPYLTVAEAISVQRKDKLTTFVGLVLASFNPLHLERIFAEITMQDHLPDHLKNIKIGDIPIAGRKIKEVQYDVEKIY